MTDKWIPVTEKLPRNGEIVKAMFDELSAIHNVTYSRDYDWWFFDGYERCPYAPTHWQPIQPPQTQQP